MTECKFILLQVQASSLLTMSLTWKTGQIPNLTGKQARSSSHPGARRSHPLCTTEDLTWKEPPPFHRVVVRNNEQL